MTDQHFDDSIRSKLSDYKSDVEADWLLFQEKLHKSQEQEFDHTLASKLKGHTSKSAPQWDVLKSRYDYLESLRRHVHSVKQLELVSMLILLLIFVGVIEYGKGSPSTHESQIEHIVQNKLQEEKLEEISEVLQDAALKASASVNEEAVRQTEADVNSELDRSALDVNSKPSAEKAVENTSEDAESIVLASSQKQLQLPSVSSSMSLISDLNSASIAESSSQIKENSASQTIESSSFIYNTADSRERITVARLSQRSLELFELDRRDLFFYNYESPFTIRPQRKIKRQYLQLYASFDNNFIHTPDDLAYNTNSRTTEMYGYSLGALYSVKFAGLEYETGLGYSSFDKPWNFNMQYGNSDGWFSFVLTNIHYDILTIPLQVKKHLVENADWSVYAMAGVSNEIIMSSEYNMASSYLGGGSVPVGSQGGTPDIVSSPFENERYFTKGLLEGEAFSKAYFMRAMIGGGFQRNVTNSLSICVGGAYYKPIVNTGLGPNNDRIDRFSVNFGLKKLLN